MTRNAINGFTLVELMIVVAVVGILAAFALPSYMKEVERSRETEGQALITRILQNQERYYTENLTYTDQLTDLGYDTDTDIESEEGHYKASASVCVAPAPVTLDSCVLITGTSTTGGETLTINSMGNKSW
jgi:type IV pilus assembly protein PilE